jgi:ABC-type transport system involved in multi-copper enzyme maturation permease subunit
VSGAFGGIVRFELGYYLRRISTWVYFLIFFALGFLLVQLAGGAWDSEQEAHSGSGCNVYENSAYSVAGSVATLALFGVLVTAALLGNAIYRDFDTRIHPLFFTTPVSKRAYLGGRFTGALIVNALVFVGIPLGLLVGSLMPWLDAERMGPVHLAYYVQPYLVFVLPDLLLTGAIFFSLAAVTRRMLPNHVGGVFLLVGYLLSSEYLSQLENRTRAALIDPFGAGALDVVTKYWTPAERNVRMVPFDGLLLANRAIWVAVGLAIFALGYARFRFSHQASEGRRRAAGPEAEAAKPRAVLSLPAVHREFGARAQLRQYLSLVRRSFWAIVGNRYFFAIAGAGVLFMGLTATQVDKIWGTTTWPVTYSVLDALGGIFWIFMLIVISFYAGELIWAEREVKLSQVFDATPVRGWVPLLAKWTALALMLVVLQTTVLLTGVATQALKGYYHFQIGLYLRELYGLQLLSLVLLSALVVLVHVVVNHKYMGHLIVILFLVFTSFMGQMGLEHSLYHYNSGGTGTYSDMNGFGPWMTPFFWFKGYWAAWALLFAVASNLFWVRGEETGAGWRVRMARLRFTRPALSAAALAAVLILGLGGFIFYNTNVLNEYHTGFQEEERTAEYERLYKRYENLPQPRIVGVKVDVEMYPSRRDLHVTGRYRLTNKSGVAVDSLHVRVPTSAEIGKLALGVPAKRVLDDEEHGYYVYRLARPLQPGDSTTLDFDVWYRTHGFANGVELQKTQVLANGSFVNSGRFPSLGYDAGNELSDDQTRRKHHLKPKERMRPVNDPIGRRNTYISNDADWVDFEATVGTAKDQIAVAPGYLQREWTQGDRRYFRYAGDAPILNFFSFLSARYAVRKDRWHDIAIEIYYQPGHEYNLDRMVAGVKKSLDYYEKNFGPYQFRQVRILEFPRYASFAQSFANTIPFSESIGFIARVKDPEEDIDYPFFVTAHEVGHQWWAHQVIGGNVQGSTLLSEGLAEYSALMVMEHEYGRDQARKFLEYEMDGYLRGRAFERKKEVPLLKVENQPYIHYQKGALALYALRDYIGEEKLNGALRDYLNEVKFQQPPYTNSLELYRHLQAVTPDSLKYVLHDLFETITLYDNRATRATSKKLPDGRYEVTMTIEASKLQADSLGNESRVPMNDLVDVGVFLANPKKKTEPGAPLYLAKRRIHQGAQTVTVVVDRQPARAGIDPYHKLIDRNGDDNTVGVK